MVVNNSEPRRAAETMSETSEGTATTSVSGKSGFESREELRDLAAELDIDPEDLHQERFRVDRRKLEQMLLGEWARETRMCHLANALIPCIVAVVARVKFS